MREGFFSVKKVLVTYYSQSGNTEKMAKSIHKTLTGEHVESVCKPIEDVQAQDLLEFDGIIIGSPTYL